MEEGNMRAQPIALRRKVHAAQAIGPHQHVGRQLGSDQKWRATRCGSALPTACFGPARLVQTWLACKASSTLSGAELP